MQEKSAVRVRFAPSPTGYLHVGSARTAFYNWLFARQTGGTFILRIEDTDLERSTQEAVNAILESMAWLGLDYDEGPFFQTHRFARYREVAELLLAQNLAYKCYCSKDRLEELRNKQLANKEKPKYDGYCLKHQNQHDNNLPYVIRFKNPTDGAVEFDDLVRGKISIKNIELDDLIIMRQDGSPTYNFTVVVDDLDMRITHVIRGEDHIGNTPRQINLMRALKGQVPLYGHIPLILAPDGSRLSKRYGAVSVLNYRDLGYLPHALLNYLVRLGWAYKDQEIFSLDDIVKYFAVENINKSGACFDINKLNWLNQHYLKQAEVDLLAKLLREHINKLDNNLKLDIPDFNWQELVILQRERAKTLQDMAKQSLYFFADKIELDLELKAKYFPQSLAMIKALHAGLLALTTWQKEDLHQVLKTLASDLGVKLGDLAQPVRFLLTGGTVSPPLDATLALLGKTKTLARLSLVIND